MYERNVGIMKIELLNREHWLTQISINLQWIKDYRSEEDVKFIEHWRKRNYLPNRGEAELPEHGKKLYGSNTGFMQYPCQDYYGTESTLKKLRRALNTLNTGSIYVDDDELRALSPYKAKEE
jgi:hypothetical protein